jgi:hypothetical protein
MVDGGWWLADDELWKNHDQLPFLEGKSFNYFHGPWYVLM